MAAVTQCDVCNNVVKNEQALYLRINSCSKDGKLGAEKIGKDICPDCANKIYKLIDKRPSY